MTTVLPSVAVLELTYRCNHACRFCSCPWLSDMMKIEPEMTICEWMRLIDELSSAGVRQFSFTGGEALLKEGCMELLDFAAKRALIGLLSNGRLVTDSVISFCAERGIRLSVSMPGLNSYTTNTDSDTPVEHILDVFAKAKRLGCTTTVGITVTKLNLAELYETISAALIAGADTLLLNRFLPGGRGLSHPELLLTVDEVRKAADIAEDVLSRANRRGTFGTEMPACLIDRSRYQHLNVATGCSAATDFFVVGANGKIRVCNHSPVELMYWDNWRSLPECSEWMHYVRHDYLPDMCVGCWQTCECLGACREAARVFSGSPTDPDPLFSNVRKDS